MISCEYVFAKHLLTGEKILWCARSAKSIQQNNHRISWGTILLGFWFFIPGIAVVILPWVGFITDRPANSQELLVFVLGVSACTIVGGLFAWIGLSSWGVLERTRGELLYAVTDKRALLISSGRRTKVIALNLTSVKDIQSRTDADGSGSLTLVECSGNTLDFEGIRDIERVHLLINQQIHHC